MRERIVIGDCHGCIDEFNELLNVINYSRSRHRLILVGDLLDRGKDPIGLLNQIRAMELEVVLSNHEQKAYNWRRFEEQERNDGKPNPIKEPNPKRKREWLSLSEEDLLWIKNLPHILDLENEWYVVHGGLEASKSMKEQVRDNVIRTRVLDKNGDFVKMRNGEPKPEGTEFWATAWNRPHNIIFGHTVFKKPKVFTNSNNMCIGIDTGCVYGGHLTSYNIDRAEFVQVKSRKKYYSPQ